MKKNGLAGNRSEKYMGIISAMYIFVKFFL